MTMQTISKEELKARIDRGDEFRLVNVLSEWAFEAKHIPGSINLPRPELIRENLKPGDDIVVYCANELCTASIMAYNMLVSQGFESVRRYAGGVQEWEAAGFPLEGSMANS
jgi:rhodanese-related sulfurtransferase